VGGPLIPFKMGATKMHTIRLHRCCFGTVMCLQQVLERGFSVWNSSYRGRKIACQTQEGNASRLWIVVGVPRLQKHSFGEVTRIPAVPCLASAKYTSDMKACFLAADSDGTIYGRGRGMLVSWTTVCDSVTCPCNMSTKGSWPSRGTKLITQYLLFAVPS